MDERMKLLVRHIHFSEMTSLDAIGTKYQIGFQAGWVELSKTPDEIGLSLTSDELRQLADIADLVGEYFDAVQVKDTE